MSASKSLPLDVRCGLACALKAASDNKRIEYSSVLETVSQATEENHIFSLLPSPEEFNTQGLNNSFLAPMKDLILHSRSYNLGQIIANNINPYWIGDKHRNHDDKSWCYCFDPSDWRTYAILLIYTPTLLLVSPILTIFKLFLFDTNSGDKLSTISIISVGFVIQYILVFMFFILFSYHSLYTTNRFQFGTNLSIIWNNYVYFPLLLLFICYLISPIIFAILPYYISRLWIKKFNLRLFRQRNLYEMATMTYIMDIIQYMVIKCEQNYNEDNRVTALLLYIINWKILGDKGGFGNYLEKSYLKYHSDVVKSVNSFSSSEISKDINNPEPSIENAEEYKSDDNDSDEFTVIPLDFNGNRDKMIEFDEIYLQYDLEPNLDSLNFESMINGNFYSKGIQNVNKNEEYKQYIFFYICHNICKKFLVISLIIQFGVIICSLMNDFIFDKNSVNSGNKISNETFYFGLIKLCAMATLFLVGYTYSTCNSDYLSHLQRYLLLFDPIIKNIDDLECHWIDSINIYPKNVSLYNFITDIELNKKLIYAFFVHNFIENKNVKKLLDDYYKVIKVDSKVLKDIINKEMKFEDEAMMLSESIAQVILNYAKVIVTKKDVAGLFK